VAREPHLDADSMSFAVATPEGRWVDAMAGAAHHVTNGSLPLPDLLGSFSGALLERRAAFLKQQLGQSAAIASRTGAPRSGLSA